MNEIGTEYLEDLIGSCHQAMKDQEQLTLEALERITGDLKKFVPSDWKAVSEDLKTIAYACGLRHDMKRLLGE